MTRKLTLVLFLLLTINAHSQNKEPKVFLKTVLNKLESIESASYRSIREGWAPYDTIASIRMDHLVKEYNNPQDSTIGASMVSIQQNDTTQMTFCYDGQMRAVTYEDDKEIVIDSFKIRKYPFRPLSAPFFNYSKSIIKYALETKDSISVKMEEKEKKVYFCLTIFENQQVEFFGKAYYYPKSPFDFGDPTSKYEIWVDKSTNLPFKVRREMSHCISAETVSDVSLNKLKLNDFRASDYFMPDYKIKLYYSNDNKERKENILLGKKAPDWTLVNVNNNPVSLSDLKGKVKIVQFTSVLCGPCRASIPFLNELASLYNNKDVDLVAIECATKSLDALNKYKNFNKINYSFLKSDKTVLDEYEIKSFPIFFVIDKDLVVREVLTGYGFGTTDTHLKNIIDKMIQ